MTGLKGATTFPPGRSCNGWRARGPPRQTSGRRKQKGGPYDNDRRRWRTENGERAVSPSDGGASDSLDGYMQGANGEVDWVDGWNDGLDLLSDVDAAVIGAGTYPGYEQLWGSIAADPQSGTAMLGREPSAGEVEYAAPDAANAALRPVHHACDDVNWETAHLIRDVSELRKVKDRPGGAIYVIGGASLVSNLLDVGFIDELHLIVHPIILGGGKAPLAGVKPQKLELLQSRARRSGRVVLDIPVLQRRSRTVRRWNLRSVGEWRPPTRSRHFSPRAITSSSRASAEMVDRT